MGNEYQEHANEILKGRGKYKDLFGDRLGDSKYEQGSINKLLSDASFDLPTSLDEIRGPVPFRCPTEEELLGLRWGNKFKDYFGNTSDEGSGRLGIHNKDLGAFIKGLNPEYEAPRCDENSISASTGVPQQYPQDNQLDVGKIGLGTALFCVAAYCVAKAINIFYRR